MMMITRTMTAVAANLANSSIDCDCPQKFGGYIGEHNATELVIIPSADMSNNPEITNYCVLFSSSGNLFRSKVFNSNEEIRVRLWQQLTTHKTLNVQLEGYDKNNTLIVKSPLITSLYFLESSGGTEIPVDTDSDSLSAQVSQILTKLNNLGEVADIDLSEYLKSSVANDTFIKTALIALSIETPNSDNFIPSVKAIKEALSKKVDIEEGKALSSNDYSDSEKDKLNGIEAGAQVNPTKLSELENDSDFLPEDEIKALVGTPVRKVNGLEPDQNGNLTLETVVGNDGKSAYEIAVEGGYEGSKEAWIASLKGANGNNGKSAYAVAVEQGYDGDENAWIASLKGASGTTFVPSVSEDGTLSWSNEDGKANPASVNIKGNDGKTGTTIYTCSESPFPQSALVGDLVLITSNSIQGTSLGDVLQKSADGWRAVGNLRGTSGANGVTYTPTITEEGILSWTNNGGLSNPPDINIKGTDGTNVTETQVINAVNEYMESHPESTTTVQDKSLTFAKLAFGTGCTYECLPYFTGASPGVGDTAIYGAIGQIIPVKPGKTYYCNYSLSSTGITSVQIMPQMPTQQYGPLVNVIGTIAASDDGVYVVPSTYTEAKAAFFPIAFIGWSGNEDITAGIDALNNGNTPYKATRESGRIIQDAPFSQIPATFGRNQTASFRINNDQNQILYASLYSAVSDLVGAKVAVLGDSLTEQSAAANQTNLDKWMEDPYAYDEKVDVDDDGTTYSGSGWFAMIAKKYMLKWYCAGHGQQRWYSTTTYPKGATAMVRKLIDGTDEFDYIILEYGTNDALSATYGSAEDEASETATTSVGAIKWCIEQLQTRFPSARIIVIMPCLRSNSDGSIPSMQRIYMEEVDGILQDYGVRRVYMSSDSGITKSMMNPDGIHLSKSYKKNNIIYYTNDSEAVRRFSRCLEAEMLKA